VLLGPAEPTNRLSAARDSLLVGQGTPKQHSSSRAPELRGWAKLMDSPSQAATMGVVVDLAGGPVRAGGAATVATMQGRSGRARGRMAARTAAAARRAQAALLADRGEPLGPP
jgi:hypothetical protein